MASLYADLAFDHYAINLNLLIRGIRDVAFGNNKNLTAGSLSFEDIFAFSWQKNQEQRASGFLGKGFIVDQDILTDGIVQGYADMLWTGSEYRTAWMIYGTDIPADDVMLAIESVSPQDDAAIFARMLGSDDRFDLGNLADRAIGFGGNDLLNGLGGNDTLRGGTGNDTLAGGAGNDVVFLDAGQDVLRGEAGIDWLRVEGNSPVAVNLATTVLQATGLGRDLIVGFENAIGGGGRDRLVGSGSGNRLEGQGGDDWLAGLVGNDILVGGLGHDGLQGGLGLDTLLGGTGNDSLDGGRGRDLLSGGAGADRFIFRTLFDSSVALTQADMITDFRRGQDIIDLRPIDGAVGIIGNNAFAFVGVGGIGASKAGAVAIRKYDRPGTAQDLTVALIDNDSDGMAEMTLRLRGLYDLSASDFYL